MILRLLMEDLSMSYRGRTLFSGLSLTLSPGDRVVVSGSNGTGKSTFLKIAAGLTRPDIGRIALDAGGDGAPKPLREYLGYAGPDVNPYEELTAIENLEFIARLRGLAIDADALLDRLGLTARARRTPVKSYSSGMRQRVRLAASLIAEPIVLLWDEPTAMLDEQGRRVADEILTAHTEAGGMAVIATNDSDEIGRWGGRRIHFGDR
ncbi:ABC transporter ATP-binding protein [Capsulimonas corticalis]|nr:ABC transporter ATP-binding protein [Capsulimonas corticalis]